MGKSRTRADKAAEACVSLPYPLVMVEWEDASRLNDGWMDLAAVPDPYAHRCVTVGFLLSENERGKILVPTIGDVEHAENSHTYGGMMIPISAIIRERRLR
jgi:hypothetical protein